MIGYGWVWKLYLFKMVYKEPDKKKRQLNKPTILLILSFLLIFILLIFFYVVLPRLGELGYKIVTIIYNSIFYIVSSLMLLYLLILIQRFLLRKKNRSKQNLKSKPEKIITKEDLKKSIKKLNQEKNTIKRLEFSYFFLFIVSFAAFIALYIYGNMPMMFFALFFMFMSLLGNRISMKSKDKTKTNIFLRFFKKKEPKDAEKEADNPKDQKNQEPIKELPNDLKSKLGKYETDLDLIYKIVEEKGSIKISSLAKQLNVNSKKIEEWANILESYSILKVHYPAIGEPELIKWK
jgi:hypothetical protein